MPPKGVIYPKLGKGDFIKTIKGSLLLVFDISRNGITGADMVLAMAVNQPYKGEIMTIPRSAITVHMGGKYRIYELDEEKDIRENPNFSIGNL